VSFASSWRMHCVSSGLRAVLGGGCEGRRNPEDSG
jgi:hypothetical protein